MTTPFEAEIAARIMDPEKFTQRGVTQDKDFGPILEELMDWKARAVAKLVVPMLEEKERKIQQSQAAIAFLKEELDLRTRQRETSDFNRLSRKRQEPRIPEWMVSSGRD